MNRRSFLSLAAVAPLAPAAVLTPPADAGLRYFILPKPTSSHPIHMIHGRKFTLTDQQIKAMTDGTIRTYMDGLVDGHTRIDCK